MKKHFFSLLCGLSLLPLLTLSCTKTGSAGEELETLPEQCRWESAPDPTTLANGFMTPPDEARAWVYWFFMDGNMSREGLTADLEAMKRAGIGGAIFLEVNVGVPRGPVDFMSDEWIDLFSHATREAKRLGIELTLISGPGWTGSGGPWVKPEDAMHFIVADTLSVRGGGKVSAQLPRAKARDPYFGNGNLTERMVAQKDSFYTDLFVLAYPKPSGSATLPNIDEKALYIRHPYTSRPNTNPYLDAPAAFPPAPEGTTLAVNQCIDVTAFMNADGVLEWDAPEGDWLIYRFGRTLTSANTRPAPLPGVGFECSKMDTTAFNHHLDAFVGRLAKATGVEPGGIHKAGWNMLHIDSWEMGPQNWSSDFREQFTARRGYDPLPYLATVSGNIVESREISERFLWDYRTTITELILENHAQHLKRVAHRYGMGLSIEPYDMSPNNDIALGSVADVPMCEFWEKDDLFNSAFSCIESVSAAHINNRPIIGAEAFTSHDSKSWRVNPGVMKDQADWAFCVGINRFVFHRYAHQPWLDRFPGMTMGPYGAHYERTQTWWDLSGGWHTYLSRCQYMLRQGQPVADILYLTPEGAPHAFAPPVSALNGTERLPFRRAYNFDGCDPGTLIAKATVKEGKIVFPGEVTYSLLVLPTTQTMTPQLLEKIDELCKAGATVLGYAPQRSPSLENYPRCDTKIEKRVAAMWGTVNDAQASAQKRGKGTLYTPAASDTLGRDLSPQGFMPPYVKYDAAVNVLQQMGVLPDFESSVPLRYIHRNSAAMDIYMISNPTDQPVMATCTFRVTDKTPSLWCAVQGQIAPATAEATEDNRSRLTLPLEPHGSLFVVFSPNEASSPCNTANLHPDLMPVTTLDTPWQVNFQRERGAPASVTFTTLSDWSQNPDAGIRYFSGIADYNNAFTLTADQLKAHPRWFIDLGQTAVMARVTLNGISVSELWSAPYRCEITPYIKEGENTLLISVANEWPNRMAGDQLVAPEKRITFSTYNNFTKDFKLLPSGLMGPVQIYGAH